MDYSDDQTAVSQRDEGIQLKDFFERIAKLKGVSCTVTDVQQGYGYMYVTVVNGKLVMSTSFSGGFSEAVHLDEEGAEVPQGANRYQHTGWKVSDVFRTRPK